MIDADLDVAAFALVTWAPHLHVVVMGAVDVETDAPSLPLLSGRDVAYLGRARRPRGDRRRRRVVRRRARRRDGRRPRRRTRRRLPADHRGRARGATATTAAPEPAPPEPPDPEPAFPVAAASTGAALLDLVTGGDWMDDSIGLAAPGALLDEPAAPEPEPEPVPIVGPTVPGRRCPSGHPNPPTRATCQRCGDLVDLATPLVDVPQPVLAELVSDDGVHDADPSGRSSSAATPIRPRPASTTTPNDSCCQSGQACHAPTSSSAPTDGRSRPPTAARGEAPNSPGPGPTRCASSRGRRTRSRSVTSCSSAARRRSGLPDAGDSSPSPP